jgi:O-antigen ligase
VTTTAVQHPYDFDPALLAGQTYASRRRRRLIDMPAVISIMLILTFVLPTPLVVPQLTGVGRPALMVGLVLTGLWLLAKLHPRIGTRGPQPMRWAAMFFFVSFLMSYAAGYLRGMAELEANAADTALIGIVIFLGIILAAADFMPNRARLDGVIRTAVWGAAFMALIGHLETLLGRPLTNYLTLPGLTLHTDLEGLEARGVGFYRVASTATHYIEFSTVMAMMLPFAIHTVIYARTRTIRQNALIAAVLIGAAIPVALSRTGILALIVGMAAMFPAWSWRMRFNLGVLGFGMIAAMMVVRPGLLGTIRSLFLDLGGDPSIQGRTDDYSVVSQYIAERPILGRGLGTFIPKLYIILDNQWLHQMIGGGIVGVIALAGLHLTAIVLCLVAISRTPSAEDRHLCACLIAVQLIALVAHGTFDTFAFSTFTTLLALFTGMAGAMWRLTHPARQIRSVGRQHIDTPM